MAFPFRRWRWWLLATLFPATLLALLTYYLTPEPAPAPAPASASPIEAPAPTSLPPREISLFFPAVDGREVISEAREIPDCADDESCLRAILKELLRGSKQGLAPAFSTATQLNHVEIDDISAHVDLSPAATNEHPGGSLSEYLSGLALANSVAANFPHLRQVRLTLDGKEVDSLKGHLDLRQPLIPDFNRLSSEQESAPPSPLADQESTL
ncbi:MAG: hypothetical protein C0621_01490 [Desulfuromonas sp.]|nr:MAG: hypothetical protein C0621_01490 [Desulfuromonas sp.]